MTSLLSTHSVVVFLWRLYNSENLFACSGPEKIKNELMQGVNAAVLHNFSDDLNLLVTSRKKHVKQG